MATAARKLKAVEDAPSRTDEAQHVISWEALDVRADKNGFRERAVRFFLEYRGFTVIDEATGEPLRDKSNRIVKVTATTFAGHYGFEVRSFRNWVKWYDPEVAEIVSPTSKSKAQKKSSKKKEGNGHRFTDDEGGDVADFIRRDIVDAIGEWVTCDLTSCDRLDQLLHYMTDTAGVMVKTDLDPAVRDEAAKVIRATADRLNAIATTVETTVGDTLVGVTT